MKKQIFVTEPHLPSLEEFIPYLEKIWDNKILTNGGPFHQSLEKALCNYLGVPYISLFANGTLALVTALQALRITGEVITTPYSFVATSHALLWNGVKPIFVDIDPKTFNLDPEKIEAAITPQTTAILPVHCYGRPCDIDAIQNIADKYNLRVIYDAAHAFGVHKDGESILNAGDLSVLSFHATKVFNTFEGGAIVCADEKTKNRIDHLKNFGFVDEVTVVAPGINGKMSEFNAALGLLQLKGVDDAIHRRKEIDFLYRLSLKKVTGIIFPEEYGDGHNYSYCPVLIDSNLKISRDQLYEMLRGEQIYARRYFYPLISTFSMYRSLLSARSENLKNATDISNSVICLPIFPNLSNSQVMHICELIKKICSN